MRTNHLEMICSGFTLVVRLGGSTPMVAHAEDVEGSQDHPLIKRYPGSVIWEYDLKEFSEYEIPMGKAEGDKFAKTQRLEGKVTTGNYEKPEKRSVREIFRNYASALNAAGFETLFPCGNQACGSGSGPVDQLRNWGWSSAYGQRHLTGKLARPEGDVYVSLHVQGKNPDEPYTFLTIVETKPMETGLVTVDAAALAGDISRTGHVAFYAIYFDFGKAEVKPESEPTLREIAKLLQQDPKLKLHVVGHTDSVGELAANMDLSRRRANAVVQVLTTRYGIAGASTPEGDCGRRDPPRTQPNANPAAGKEWDGVADTAQDGTVTPGAAGRSAIVFLGQQFSETGH